ncbi:MAG: hypothetical protein EOO17_04910 [Chloroflexi bacterium]|nr:MAG: hypothetical protein EOO17_04910 [Chloroflexota bacterium]
MPLLGTWFVLKGVMSVGGTIGNKISGRGDRSNIKAKAESKTGTPKQAPAPQSKLMGRTFDRKPAFSRLRRRKSAAGSALPGSGGSKSGTKSATGAAGSANKSGLDPLASNLANNAGDMTESGMTPEQIAEQALKDGKVNDTDAINANANVANAGDAADTTAAIQAQLATPEKDGKQKDEKPWEKLRGAKPATGGGGGSSNATAASTPSAPVAPSSNFQAPGTAQAASAPGKSSAPQAAPTIIAVPVQVDGAALLSGHDTPRYSPEARGMQPLTQPPISGTQEKAKARAQKYIFDAASSLEETEKEIDRLLGDRTKVAKELEQKDSDTKKDA